MDYKINFVKLTRKEWLKELPEVIYNLKKNYNFYYSKRPIEIKRDIKDIVEENYDRNRHKIILYRTKNRELLSLYLVVYAKKTVTIYYCLEYRYEQNIIFTDLDGNPTGQTGNKNQWTCIKRFMKKFDLAYEKAVKERIECSVSNLMESDSAQ